MRNDGTEEKEARPDPEGWITEWPDEEGWYPGGGDCMVEVSVEYPVRDMMTGTVHAKGFSGNHKWGHRPEDFHIRAYRHLPA